MRALVLLLLLAISLVTGTDRAIAHAALVTSEPADGSVLHERIKVVKLTFSESVAPVALRLLKADGHISLISDYRQEGETLIVSLPTDVPIGTNILSWRVTSQDGHPVGGTVTFSIEKIDPDRLSGSADSQGWNVQLWILHYADFALTALVVGVAFFCAWFRLLLPRRLKPWLVFLSFAGATTTLGVVFVEALDAVGDSPSDLIATRLWWHPIATAFGWSSLATISALVLATVSLIGSRASPKILSSASLALTSCAFVLSGHAAAASPGFLMKPSIFVHIAGVLFWSGSLVPLFALARGKKTEIGRVLAAYSLPILLAVILILATGVTLAAVQMGKVSELWDSGYGVVLSAKLALLLPLFALAGFNRFQISPRIAAGYAPAVVWLKYSVAAEIALVALILGVVSLWRFTPPPREMAAVTVLSTGVQFHAHGTQGMANVIVSPARPGPVSVAVNVMDVQSRPLGVQGVEIVLLDPKNQIEPIRRQAHRLTPSSWKIDEMPIPSAGLWLVRVNLLVSDFEKVTVRTTLNIKP